MFPPAPGPRELSRSANRRSRIMRRGTVVRGARPAVVLMAAGIAVAGALAPAIAGTPRHGPGTGMRWLPSVDK